MVRPKPAGQYFYSWLSLRSLIRFDSTLGLLHSRMDSECFHKVINQELFWYSNHSIGLPVLLAFSTILRFHAPKSMHVPISVYWFPNDNKISHPGLILLLLHLFPQRSYSKLLDLRSNRVIGENSIASRKISIPSSVTVDLFHSH